MSVLGAMAALAFVFLKLGSEVAEGDTRAFDRAILMAMRVPGNTAIPRGPSWLRESVTDLSSMGSPTVLGLILLLVAGFYICRGQPRLAAFHTSVMASGFLVVTIFKTWFDRARPDVAPHLVPVHSLSFPSGHAADSAIVYLTIAMLVQMSDAPRAIRIYLTIVAMALTVAIGLTRTYLGVHWPSDVAAGWAFGAFWAMLGNYTGRAIKIV